MARGLPKKSIKVEVELVVPRFMTIAQTRREVRSRINDLCGFHSTIRSRDRVYFEDDITVRAKRVK